MCSFDPAFYFSLLCIFLIWSVCSSEIRHFCLHKISVFQGAGNSLEKNALRSRKPNLEHVSRIQQLIQTTLWNLLSNNFTATGFCRKSITGCRALIGIARLPGPCRQSPAFRGSSPQKSPPSYLQEAINNMDYQGCQVG